MTNHDKIKKAFESYTGSTFATQEIKKIIKTEFPDFSDGSVLPNDHATGNASPCWCAGTDRRIFDKISHGYYKVR